MSGDEFDTNGTGNPLEVVAMTDGEFMSTLETLDPVEGGMLLDEHEYDLASAKSTRPSDVHLHEALHNLDVGPPSNPETRCV